MAEVRLVAPRVRVIRDGEAEALEVQCDNRDLIAWDRTRVKHKWPPLNEAPFMWLTFISWSAARRTGAVNGLTYETWESQVLSVADMSGDPDSDEGRPTPPGPAPG